MKQKIFNVFIIVSFLSYSKNGNLWAQKVVKEYFSYSTKLRLEYQIDPKTGAKNGFYKSYLQNGQLSESGNFKMGKKNGAWTTYYDDGTGRIIATENFNLGMKNGIQRQYCFTSYNRYLCGEFRYSNDTLKSETTFYSNGNKNIENKYYPLPGYSKSWFEDGKPKIETKFGKTFHLEEESKVGDITGRYVSKVEFDSAGFQYEYRYNAIVDYRYDEKLRTSIPFIKKISISDIIMSNKVSDGQISGYRFYFDIYELEAIGRLLRNNPFSKIAKPFKDGLKNAPDYMFIGFLENVYNLKTQRSETPDSITLELANRLFKMDPISSKEKIVLPEATMNDLGYSYLKADMFEEAINVFKTNTQLHPNSWNAWDSYGEGLAKADKKQEAITAYKKSIELNPNNHSGARALKQLQE